MSPSKSLLSFLALLFLTPGLRLGTWAAEQSEPSLPDISQAASQQAKDTQSGSAGTQEKTRDASTEQQRAQQEADIGAFIKAAEEGDLKTLQSLTGKVDVNAENDEGERALNRAILKGHTQIVQYLIDNGADVNHAGKHGDTPLFDVTRAEHDKVIPIAKLLIDSGANAEAEDEWGQTPLRCALDSPSNSKTRLITFLIEHTSDLAHYGSSEGYQTTYLHLIAWGGAPEHVEAILSRGVDINATDTDGETALHCALQNMAMAKLLIEKGANANAKSKAGVSPFQKALVYANKEMVNLLISAGADIRQTNTSGQTALHTALSYPDKDILDLLLATDIDVNAKDSEGHTALRVAIEHAYCAGIPEASVIGIITSLIAAGADVNAQDNNGRTPLQSAVITGEVEIVRHLLDAGADVNTKDAIGRTALHYAIGRMDYALRDLLIECGAKTDIAPMRPGRQPALEQATDIASLGLPLDVTSSNRKHSGCQVVDLAFNISNDDVLLYPAQEEQEYLRISNQGVTLLAIPPGSPQLPMKTFPVKLPLHVEVVDVEVVEGELNIVKGDHRIVPGPQPLADGRAYYPDKAIYERAKYCPGRWLKYDSGKDNCSTLVLVRFYPVQYLPTEGKLAVAVNARIRLYYRSVQDTVIVASTSGGRPAEEQTNVEKVISPTVAQSVIIFPESLRPAAEQLRQFHEDEEGISTALISTDSIDAVYLAAEEAPFEGYANADSLAHEKAANYDYSLARKIVSYLRNTAAHPRLEFVTLFGDGGLVPPSYMFSGRLLDFEDTPYWGPTDFLYMSPDYDLVPNYKVGRLPVSNNTEGLAMVEKMRRWYRQADWQWFRNVSVHGTKLDYRPGRELHPYRHVFFRSQLMKNVFENLNVSETLSADGVLQREKVDAVLRKGGVGFVLVVAHGYPTAWSMGSPPWHPRRPTRPRSGIRATELMTYDGVDKLPIVIGVACHSGFYAHDNTMNDSDSTGQGLDADQPMFGEATLKSPAGAIAYFGDTSIGSISAYLHYDCGKIVVDQHADSGGLAYYMMKSYHEGAGTLGKLFEDGVLSFVVENEMDFWKNRFTLLEFVLLGDPALKICLHPRFQESSGSTERSGERGG